MNMDVVNDGDEKNIWCWMYHTLLIMLLEDEDESKKQSPVPTRDD